MSDPLIEALARRLYELQAQPGHDSWAEVPGWCERMHKTYAAECLRQMEWARRYKSGVDMTAEPKVERSGHPGGSLLVWPYEALTLAPEEWKP